MAIGFIVAAIAITGCAVAGPNKYVPWLMAAGVGCGDDRTGHLCHLPRTLAGPQATGKWYGAQNGFSNLAGVVGPALTGFVLERTGNFCSAIHHHSRAMYRRWARLGVHGWAH